MATFSSLKQETGARKFHNNLNKLRMDLVDYHHPFSGNFIKKTLDAIQYLEDRMLDDTSNTSIHLEKHRS